MNDSGFSVAQDATQLRRIYGCFPSGVVAVCCDGRFGPVGFAASSFTSVSLVPPLVSFCVRNESTTWPRMVNSARLGVSVLAADQSVVCRQLASTTGDRFAGLSLSGDGGAVFLDGAVAHLSCTIYAVVPAGDHQIVLLRIESSRIHPGQPEPLVFHAGEFKLFVA
jgi:flavin reductase (DIM6/NTAB) family NADH-FMN oxidoreductase RutF